MNGVANTLAYYDTATITAVKSFIVQAPVHYDLYSATVLQKNFANTSLAWIQFTDEKIPWMANLFF